MVTTASLDLSVEDQVVAEEVTPEGEESQSTDEKAPEPEGTEEESPEAVVPEAGEGEAPAEETGDEGEFHTDAADEPESDSGDEPDLGGVSADLASHSAVAERAGAEVPGCHYAPDGTGTYAGSLCWLSFPGLTTQVNRNSDGTYTSLMGAEYSQYISAVHEVVTNLETARWDADASKWVTDKEVIRGFFGNITDYPVTIPLQGGLTLTAKLDVIGSAGNTMADNPVDNANKWRSQVLKATQFPTFANSFLGNQINGQNFYYPVEGSPALYQRGGNITRAEYNTATGNAGGAAIPGVNALSTMTLKDIVILDVNGNAVPEFAVVVADAESTDAQAGWPEDTSKYQEYIKWNTDGAFTWLPNNQVLNGTERERFVGNSCGASTSPAFDATVATNAKNASCYAAVMNVLKTGTAMLAAHHPTYVRQEMLGGGLEGVAFGLMFATVETTVTVTDRIVDGSGQPQGGAFTADAESIALAAGTGEATTGSLANNDTDNNFGTSGVAAMPVPPSGTPVAFEAPEDPNYSRSWVCTLTGRGAGSLSQTFGDVDSPNIAGWLTTAQGGPNVKVGEKLKCDVTYTPQYLTLVKDVVSGDADATDWTLGATGATSAINGQTAGDRVTKRPVAVGDYTLVETGGVDGYALSGLKCGTTDVLTSATDKTGSVNIPKGNGATTTCTFTNTLVDSPEKEIITENQGGLAVGDTVQYKITQTVPYLSKYETVSIWDNLGEYLAYDSTVSVKLNGTTLTESVDYTFSNVAPLATWTLTGVLAHLKAGDTIEVVFNAEVLSVPVDENGEIENPGSTDPTKPGYGSEFNGTIPPPGPTPYTYWGQLKVTKVDQDNKALQGAEFQVFPRTGNECVAGAPSSGLVATGTSNNEGLVLWDNTDPASSPLGLWVADSNDGQLAGQTKVYCLYETKVPAGYIGVGVQTVTINQGALTAASDLTIENVQKQGPPLPLTGGQSAAMFTILGLVIAGGAAGGAAVVARKRRSA